MLTKLGTVGVGLALIGTAAGGISAAVASTGIPQPETIVVVAEVIEGTYVDTVDTGKVTNPGDYFVFREQLLDETRTTRLGVARGTCTLITKHWSLCEVALFIRERGEIMIEGTIRFLPEWTADLSVTGGTGEFDNVRGAAHIELLSPDSESGLGEVRVTLNLIP